MYTLTEKLYPFLSMKHKGQREWARKEKLKRLNPLSSLITFLLMAVQQFGILTCPQLSSVFAAAITIMVMYK